MFCCHAFLSHRTLICCRGAISDFYAYKQKIMEADYDPLCILVNEDDAFGDGNNFQVRGLGVLCVAKSLDYITNSELPVAMATWVAFVEPLWCYFC
jgi:hypothetical protein